MKNSRLETAVNVATLVACLGIAAAAAHYVRSPQRMGTAAQLPTAEQSPRVQPGDKITLPGPSVGKAALVVYLSPSCHFCTESMPFYRRLQHLEALQSGALQFVVASSDPEADVVAYLKSHDVPMRVFADGTAAGIKTRATPTLALVNSDGSVRSVWTGRLTADEERNVVAALGDLSRSSE